MHIIYNVLLYYLYSEIGFISSEKKADLIAFYKLKKTGVFYIFKTKFLNHFDMEVWFWLQSIH